MWVEGVVWGVFMRVCVCVCVSVCLERGPGHVHVRACTFICVQLLVT